MDNDVPAQPETPQLSSEELLQQLNAEQYEGSQLLMVLEEIAQLIAGARSLPMSSSVMVNRAHITELIESAQAAIPGDIQAANSIMSGADQVVARAREEAEAIVTQGREEAERIVAEAHAQAERLVSGERIVVMAQERSDQLIESATQRSQELADGADRYCDKQLAELEVEFEKYLRQVRAGRQVLAQRARFNPDADVAEESN